jgi:hypothetical protein
VEQWKTGMVRTYRSLAIPNPIHFITDEGYDTAFVTTVGSKLNGGV